MLDLDGIALSGLTRDGALAALIDAAEPGAGLHAPRPAHAGPVRDYAKLAGFPSRSEIRNLGEHLARLPATQLRGFRREHGLKPTPPEHAALVRALRGRMEAHRAGPPAGSGAAAEFYRPDQPRVPAGYPAGGRWTDIGGDEQGRGGTPVRIEDGRIVEGHPSLAGKRIGPLRADKDAARAGWGRLARYHGHRPEDLHQLAGEMLAHDRAGVEDRTAALRSARKTIESYGGDWRAAGLRAAHGKDATKTRGIDVAADMLARHYPHLFPEGEKEHNTDRLFDMLAAGNPKPMPEDQAYKQALEHLDANRPKRGRAARGDAYEGGGGKGRDRKVADVPFTADG